MTLAYCNTLTDRAVLLYPSVKDTEPAISITAMPEYKLIYFDLRARAEPVRIMFALAGVDYEDRRVKEDEWKELKPKFEQGQLPLLIVDGRELPQSGAIYRYVGSQCGFYPSDVWERAQVDVVTETLGDSDPELWKIFGEKDEAKKAELVRAFVTEGSLKHLDNLERLLKKNNAGTGWFVGDKITNADILAFSMLHDMLPGFTGKSAGGLELPNHTPLKDFVDRFKAQPKVADWLKKRPDNKL